jgi:hypothetical protein
LVAIQPMYGQTGTYPVTTIDFKLQIYRRNRTPWDEVKYKVLPWIVLKNGILFNHNLKETQELLPVMRSIISLSPQNSKLDFQVKTTYSEELK